MAELATVAKLVSISERREEGGGGEGKLPTPLANISWVNCAENGLK